jgi:transposase
MLEIKRSKREWKNWPETARPTRKCQVQILVMRVLTLAKFLKSVSGFITIKKAISYWGLCGAERSSANITMRTPLSKQRNKHLQTVLIEAAKMAPRNSRELAMLYEQEKQKAMPTAQHWPWRGRWWRTWSLFHTNALKNAWSERPRY